MTKPKTHNVLAAKDQLKSIVERIEAMEEEQKSLSEDKSQIYAEAKGRGFNIKILRKIIRLRKQELSQRELEQLITDLYMQDLGMPLFEQAKP